MNGAIEVDVANLDPKHILVYLMSLEMDPFSQDWASYAILSWIL